MRQLNTNVRHLRSNTVESSVVEIVEILYENGETRGDWPIKAVDNSVESVYNFTYSGFLMADGTEKDFVEYDKIILGRLFSLYKNMGWVYNTICLKGRSQVTSGSIVHMVVLEDTLGMSVVFSGFFGRNSEIGG